MRLTSEIRTLLFTCVLDAFGQGEPVEYVIDAARPQFPALSPQAVVNELREAVDDGLMRVWFINDDGSQNEATDAHYTQAVASHVPAKP